MTPFEIGVQLFPGRGSDVIREAILCEELGFDSVWMADHFHGAGRDASWYVPECFTVLAAIAARTTSIRLGSCVASTVKREPFLLTHSALTVAELAPGRFDLGVGTGFGPDLRAFGFATEGAVNRVAETIDVFRRLSASSPAGGVDLEGAARRTKNAYLNVGVDDRVPVLVAALGPRMLRITAAQADGWLPFALSPSLYRTFLQDLNVGRREFRALLWLPTFVKLGNRDLVEDAVATGRLYLSMAPQVLRAARSLGEDKVPSSLDWAPEKTRQTASEISSSLARSVTLCGTPEDCVTQLQEYERAGCNGVVLRLPTASGRSSELGRIAKEIVQAFRRPRQSEGVNETRPFKGGSD